MCKILHKS